MVNSEACGWCDERMKRNNGCARGGGGKHGRSELIGRKRVEWSIVKSVDGVMSE